MLGVFHRKDSMGEKLVIILQGLPCAWSKCIFCPFIIEQGKNIGQVIATNTILIDKAKKLLEKNKKLDRIVVFNGGSFHELPLDTVLKLEPLINEKKLEIEERSEYVTLQSLRNISRLYNLKKLVVRIGFEVIDEDVRNNYLKKGMNNQELIRTSKLRLEAREKGLPVEIWSYVLYGMRGLSEKLIMKSVVEFNKLFDGVVAIKYHKYFPNHPQEKNVSEKLKKFLLENTLYMDTGEDEIWIIKKGD